MAERGSRSPVKNRADERAPARARTKRIDAPADRRAPAASDGARRQFYASLAIAALALAAYANTLANGFVWDDRIILTRQLVVFRSVGDVLVTPRDIPQFSPDYYRPVVIASFLFDRALGGDRPLAYHLSLVAAHAAVAALVCWYAFQLFAGAGATLLASVSAAALFAVHPIHAESVAWTAGRSDVLATGFLVAALIAHAAQLSAGRRVLATGGLALLALGAKEAAIALIPLALLYDVLLSERRHRNLRQWLERYLGFIGAVVIYALLRRAALGSFGGEAAADPSAPRSLADLLAALGVYVGKLIVPFGLNAYIDWLPTDPLSLLFTAVGLALVAALTAGLWIRGEHVAVFLLAWIALTVAPSLAIVWKIPEAPVAERYLYLPSVGFCLWLGWLVRRLIQAWPRARTAVTAVVVGVVACGFVGTVLRNRVWHDDVSLWTDTAAKSRVSGFALRSLGTAHQERGEAAAAKEWFERALERRNTQRGLQITFNNLGTLAMQEQDYATAERNYRAALEANPGGADSMFNLALAVLQRQGVTPAAAAAASEILLRAETLSPHDPDIQAALGQTYAIRGDRAEAIKRLRRALDLGPPPATAADIRTFLADLEKSAPGAPPSR